MGEFERFLKQYWLHARRKHDLNLKFEKRNVELQNLTQLA